MKTSYVSSRQVDHDDAPGRIVGIWLLDPSGGRRRPPVRIVDRKLERDRLPLAIVRVAVLVLDSRIRRVRVADRFPLRAQVSMSIASATTDSP